MRRNTLALLLLCGCQDYLFEQVCPEAIRESSIVVPALAPTPTDILFVVDNSGSMADEQDNLAANFDRFIQQVAGSGDYHIAVVSTDQVNATEKSGLQNFVYSQNYPNILTDFTTSGCSDAQPVVAKGCFRGPDPSTRIVDSATMDPQTQIAVFGENVRIGSCGTGNETGLQSMISALEQRNGCNAGFLRDTANLLVIIVSDEEDFDRGTPVRQYVEQLKGVKGGAAQIRVAAIVGYWDGRADDCSIAQGNSCGGVCDNEPPQGSRSSCSMDSQCNGGEACITNECNHPDWRYWNSCFSCSFYNAPDCCSAVGGGRYVDFALAMEQEIIGADPQVDETDCRGGDGKRPACLIDTICQANFGETLAKIARDLIPRGTYNLNPPAKYAPGVNVTVIGDRFPDGRQKLVYNEEFTVTPDGSVLEILGGPNAPLDSEQIEIHFVVDSENRVEAPRGACQVSGTP